MIMGMGFVRSTKFELSYHSIGDIYYKNETKNCCLLEKKKWTSYIFNGYPSLG